MKADLHIDGTVWTMDELAKPLVEHLVTIGKPLTLVGGGEKGPAKEGRVNLSNWSEIRTKRNGARAHFKPCWQELSSAIKALVVRKQEWRT